MRDWTEQVVDWFNALGHSAQVDELIVNSLTEWWLWFSVLSLNQQLVLVSVALVLLIALVSMLKVFMGVRLVVRRWYRRRRIPRELNLHLDSERSDLTYGRDLRKNMAKMRMDAPYRKNRDQQE